MRTTGDLDLSEYFEKIPGLEICCDVDRNAMHTFKAALEKAGDSPCVHMEDDVVLCNNFKQRIIAEIEKRPNEVIQFFSMRKADLTQGSRYISGSLFCCALCFYLPKGMSAELLSFMDEWTRFGEHPNGLDYPLTSCFLGSKKVKYWNVCPNLVDHKQVKSRINPKRSTKRVSLTFKG